MIIDCVNHNYELWPNEVLEIGQLRMTNVSTKLARIPFELALDYDVTSLAAGPKMDFGIRFEVRVSYARMS